MIGPAWMASLILLGLAALLALWLRSGLVGGAQWPIRWLDVAGELERTSASQVRAAVAREAGRGFFAVDLEQVRERVETLPWIARVEVSRHWPDALLIRVEEHRPVARWNDDGLFSDRGEVFRVGGSEGMQGLARLRGPESRRGEVLDAWLQMRRALGAVGRDIERLEVDRRGAWQLRMDDGVTLVLGRERIDERLARFIAVERSLERLERPIRMIDMRYTNGLAVRWADEQQGDETSHG